MLWDYAVNATFKDWVRVFLVGFLEVIYDLPLNVHIIKERIGKHVDELWSYLGTLGLEIEWGFRSVIRGTWSSIRPDRKVGKPTHQNSVYMQPTWCYSQLPITYASLKENTTRRTSLSVLSVPDELQIRERHTHIATLTCHAQNYNSWSPRYIHCVSRFFTIYFLTSRPCEIFQR